MLFLGNIVIDGARKYPERIAIVFRDQKITYRALEEGVQTLARTLRTLGIGKGDRVGILMPNCPQAICAYFAGALCGAVVVPVNPLLKPAELQYIWGDSQIKTVLTVAPLAIGAATAQEGLPNLKHILIVDPTETLASLTLENLAPQTSLTAPVAAPMESDENDCAVIIYTSGTTGYPKGAMLSHKNLVRNVQQVQALLKFQLSDSFLTLLPLFHSFAMTVCQNLALSEGCTMVILEQFSPAKAYEIMLEHGVTVMPGVPALFNAILQLFATGDKALPKLRLAVSGGAPLPVELLHAVEKTLGIPVLEGDGPTECSPVTSVNPPDGIRKPGSVGVPLPGVEVAIFDEADNILPINAIGEIVVRGDNVMLGYLNQPQATAEVMTSGWYHTGDMGKIDEDGYVYILDRKKDMIITAGFNVYPREVEEVLLTHPAVAEACVIGIMDAKRGEEVLAVIVLKPEATIAERELSAYCRERMANYKVPRKVILRESLPKGGKGVVVKRLLKKELEMESLT